MKKVLKTCVHRLMVVVFLLIALFPVYWMLNTSLKTESEIYRRAPTFWPETFTLKNFGAMLMDALFINSLKNSMIVALVVVAFSITIAFPAAYSIARLEFKGRRFYSKAVLFGYLLPASLMYLPLYIVVSRLGLTNTLGGLMLIYPTLTLPYCCWVLIPHMRALPREVEEAAVIDGCGRLGILWRIVFPLSLNGIISTAIFAFTMSWGEYLYALVNVTSKSTKTFPLVVSDLIFGDVFP